MPACTMYECKSCMIRLNIFFQAILDVWCKCQRQNISLNIIVLVGHSYTKYSMSWNTHAHIKKYDVYWIQRYHLLYSAFSILSHRQDDSNGIKWREQQQHEQHINVYQAMKPIESEHWNGKISLFRVTVCKWIENCVEAEQFSLICEW